MTISAELSDDLCRALKSFAATEKEIVRLGVMADPNQAGALLQYRRQLVQDFADVNAALGTEPRLIDDPERMTQAMRVLAAFRTRNSINQADWPVIRVRDHPAEYQVAISHVIEASRAFWRWVETELGFRT